jgi:hypothetical protein
MRQWSRSSSAEALNALIARYKIFFNVLMHACEAEVCVRRRHTATSFTGDRVRRRHDPLGPGLHKLRCAIHLISITGNQVGPKGLTVRGLLWACRFAVTEFPDGTSVPTLQQACICILA